MKTQDLEGPILDYYVALAVGHKWRRPPVEFNGYNNWQSYESSFGNPTPPYSTDWAAGGPVMERMRIDASFSWDYGSENSPWYEASVSSHEWPEGYEHHMRDPRFATYEGKTMLIAAMRAVVAMTFGEEVPEVKP